MAFEARSGEHAIAEVVFGFQLSRPWTAAEIERLAGSHDRWRDKLPRLARHEIQQFAIGDGGQHAIAMPGGPGVSFERIQPNGDVAWRLRCEGNALLVNCLEYTRWKEVWHDAANHMRGAFGVVGPDRLAVAGTLLQHVHVFDWTGPLEEYDVFRLLDRDSDYVPRSAQGFGPVWHFHQGWFAPIEAPVPGIVLRKVHFDALRDGGKGQPTVKLDALLRMDFGGHVSANEFFKEDSPLEASFAEMHDLSNDLLRGFLTEANCSDIGLGRDG